MTETDEEIKQEVQEDSPEDTQETKPSDLKDRIEKIESDVYAEREKKLSEMETRLDRKMRDFSKLVEDAESQGITTGGQPKKTPDEEVAEQAEKDLDSFN
jgi:hypothetical protein